MCSKFAAISVMIAAALAVSSTLVGGDAGLWHRRSSCPGPGTQPRHPHRAEEDDCGSRWFYRSPLGISPVAELKRAV